jgi:DNA-binding NarL/FixJ family response regulator
MQRCRILLADGHVLFRGVLDRFLGESRGIDIISHASTGLEAISMAHLHRPDLVIVDLVMPEVSGLEVTCRLAAEPWAPRIILMSFYDGPEYYWAAEAAGADGFVLKQDLGTKLLPLIRSLMEEGANQRIG